MHVSISTSPLEISDQEVRQLLLFCSINLEVHDEDLRSNELQIANNALRTEYHLVALVSVGDFVLSKSVKIGQKTIIAYPDYQVFSYHQELAVTHLPSGMVIPLLQGEGTRVRLLIYNSKLN